MSEVRPDVFEDICNAHNTYDKNPIIQDYKKEIPRCTIKGMNQAEFLSHFYTLAFMDGVRYERKRNEKVSKELKMSKNIQMPDGYEFDKVEDGLIKLKKIVLKKFIVNRWYRCKTDHYYDILVLDKDDFNTLTVKTNDNGKCYTTMYDIKSWREVPFSGLTEEQRFLLPVKMWDRDNPSKISKGRYVEYLNTEKLFRCYDLKDKNIDVWCFIDYRDENTK